MWLILFWIMFILISGFLLVSKRMKMREWVAVLLYAVGVSFVVMKGSSNLRHFGIMIFAIGVVLSWLQFREKRKVNL